MISKKIILGTISGLIVLASANSYAAQMQTGGEIVAREASEGPRGADNERPGDRQHRGGRAIIDSGEFILAREASEGPRGADNNNHRQRRGGRASIDAGEFILAREASEGPRGADNERPGDRQRRGGRNA
ncbi:MAG: hypothetical protein WBL28_03955 [Methylotenera sp.]